MTQKMLAATAPETMPDVLLAAKEGITKQAASRASGTALMHCLAADVPPTIVNYCPLCYFRI